MKIGYAGKLGGSQYSLHDLCYLMETIVAITPESEFHLAGEFTKKTSKTLCALEYKIVERGYLTAFNLQKFYEEMDIIIILIGNINSALNFIVPSKFYELIPVNKPKIIVCGKNSAVLNYKNDFTNFHYFLIEEKEHWQTKLINLPQKRILGPSDLSKSRVYHRSNIAKLFFDIVL